MISRLTITHICMPTMIRPTCISRVRCTRSLLKNTICMLLMMTMIMCMVRTCLAILILATPESLLERKSRKFSIV